MDKVKDICHRKNAELEPKFQESQERVVLRGDSVKDDSGACAVFESGSSSQVAAKVMDVIAKPDCDGPADAASAPPNWRTLQDSYEFP